jgi:hypothetical protein
MEFLFSYQDQIKEKRSLDNLTSYLDKLPSDKTRLLGVFNGFMSMWIIGSLYLNAHTHFFGYSDLHKIPYNSPKCDIGLPNLSVCSTNEEEGVCKL